MVPSVNFIGDADKADMRNFGYIGKYMGADVIIIPQSFTDATNTTKVVDDETILEEAKNMLNRLLEKSLYSFGWSKKLLTDSFNHSLESHLELEREGLSACANHSDGQEGLKAFIEKRKPMFGK